VRTLITMGSDHNPLLLEDGARTEKEKRPFKFEKARMSED
jgi:hypothetical protein